MRRGAVLLWLIRRPAVVAVPLLLFLLFLGHQLLIRARALVAPPVVNRVPFQPLSTDYVPDELLVRFRTPNTRVVGEAVGRAGALSAVAVRNTGFYRLKLRPGQGVAEAVTALQGDAALEWAEPNYRVHTCRVPDGPRFQELWAMRNLGRTFRSRACGDQPGTKGADIGAERAWDVSRGSAQVIIAVIDTGIDPTHPNLQANLWKNPGEIPDNGIDDDKNGYIDDVYGYDFVNRKGDPKDDHGHGTHVAGTIGAAGKDASGVVGVNWDVRLMALKFLDQYGSGTIADAAEAVAYARSFGVRVTNNSWGGGGANRALFEAIRDSGALFVAAAGNAATDCDSVPFYPAAYDLPNVISVAASNPSDSLGCFSNWGQTQVDVAAPGVAILSTLPTYPCTLTENGLQQGYDYLDGTSMATPHAAGAAGLMRACYAEESPIQCRHRLIATSRRSEALRERCVSNGCINLAAAALAGEVPPIAEAGSDTAAPPGFAVALDAGASQPYPGRSLTQFAWSDNGKVIRRSKSPTLTYRSDVMGRHRLDLEVSDDHRQVGRDSLTVQIADQVATGADISVEKENRQTLWVTLTVQDVRTKKAVADAEVSLILKAPGPVLYKAGGKTNRYGQFHGEWKVPGRLAPGRYEATLTSLSHPVYIWDRKRIVGSWGG